MTPYELKKQIETQTKEAVGYRKSSEDKAAYDFVEARRLFLKQYRIGTGIEDIWRAADKAYVPHRTQLSAKRKVFVSDDELGWRSAPVDLVAEDNWQEDSVSPNPYIKIQTALGIIVDQNPSAIFNAGAKKYESNTLLMKNLYERSWQIAFSKDALLKPLVFNAARYGMGVGRTYPLNVTRSVEDIIKYDPSDPKKSEYRAVEQTYFDDVFRESLTPWNVWFDDNSVVGNKFSCNDVIYFKDYTWDKFHKNFHNLKNFKYVVPQERIYNKEGELSDFEKGLGENTQAKYVERVWFYENLELDLLFIYTEGSNGVVLVNEPIPKRPKNKQLSVWYVPWTLRDDKSIYGIGVYEAMRNDHKIHNKIRNMTVDQLVLSIYREWFYSGTDTLEGDGAMKTRPGRGRQVSDPKNVKWNEVPGPGQEAWAGMEYFDNRIDIASGISKSLQGEVTGSTAFEISQARESALKRMKTPLDNICAGLETDAYISVGIIEDLYAVPKIKLLAEDKYIEPFEIDQYQREDESGYVEGEDYEKEYREVPLNLQKGDDGEITQSEATTFFRLSPEDLPWEGVIAIDGQSIVANSELLERVTTVELANLIVPLFSGPPEIGLKPATQILKKYNEDPVDWFPDAWLNPPEPQGKPLFTPVGENGEPAEQPEGMDTVVPQNSALSKTGGGDMGGMLKKIMGG